MIYGTNGYLRVRNINNPEAIFVYDKGNQLLQTIPAPAQLTGYEYEVDETADAITAGRTECPSMPHGETLHVMELMDEIRRQLGIQQGWFHRLSRSRKSGGCRYNTGGRVTRAVVSYEACISSIRNR